MDILPDLLPVLVVGTAGLLVRLDEDVTLDGVVERGAVAPSGALLRPVIEMPRPRFVAVVFDVDAYKNKLQTIL